MVDKLLNRFGNLVKGTLTGFDRIIFKGHLKPLIFAGGVQSLLYNKNILNNTQCLNYCLNLRTQNNSHPLNSAKCGVFSTSIFGIKFATLVVII